MQDNDADELEENPVCAGLKTIIDTDAGKPLPGQIGTLWDKMMSQQDHGQPYLPFESKEEWELAYWLSMEGFLKEQSNVS